jgi:hypothetical protein
MRHGRKQAFGIHRLSYLVARVDSLSHVSRCLLGSKHASFWQFLDKDIGHSKGTERQAELTAEEHADNDDDCGDQQADEDKHSIVRHPLHGSLGSWRRGILGTPLGLWK